jgi:hypothetical protein
MDRLKRFHCVHASIDHQACDEDVTKAMSLEVTASQLCAVVPRSTEIVLTRAVQSGEYKELGNPC